MSSAQQPAQATKLISQLVREDPDLRDVVEEFVDGLPGRLDELKQAYAQLDWEMLTTLAHRLKGAGGSYGYPDISQLCAEMEQSFRSHHADEMTAWLTQLSALISGAAAGLADSAE